MAAVPPPVRVALAPDRTLGDASIQTGRTTDLVIERPRLPATVRPFGTYLPRSVLLLPRPDAPHPWAAVIALLRFLELRVDQGALLVGHQGPDEPAGLAELRAEALRLFLADDEAGWVGIAAEHGRVQDTQVFLEHLHREHGWSTHVGEITDRADSTTARAVKEFQATYNLAFHRQVFEDGVIGRQTLGAIFEVAKTELVHWMEHAQVGLHSLRFFAEDRPTLAADASFDGERWVELMAMPLWAPYDLTREPAGAGIYRVARRTPLPCEDVEPPVHGVPSALTGLSHMPFVWSHMPTSWHSSWAMQVTGIAPAQAPAWQLSACVQAFPSSHADPSALAGLEHMPVVISHVPGSWH